MAFEIAHRIKARPEQVFAQITDLHKAADRIEGIVQLDVLTEGPIRVGTRFRETRVMFGKEHSEEMEITAMEAPRYYTVEADSCGAHMTTRFDVEADGDGSMVRLRIESRPTTLFAKLLAPVTNVLLRGMIKKCLLQDLQSIQQFIENNPARDPPV